MLITDPVVAEKLVELTPLRCVILAGRAIERGMGRVCKSKFECCACGMPSRRASGRCEMCGRDNYKPFNPKT